MEGRTGTQHKEDRRKELYARIKDLLREMTALVMTMRGKKKHNSERKTNHGRHINRKERRKGHKGCVVYREKGMNGDRKKRQRKDKEKRQRQR